VIFAYFDTIGIDYALVSAVGVAIEYAAILELLNVAQKSLAPSPKSGIGENLEVNYASTEASIRIIYGTIKAGGEQSILPINYGEQNVRSNLVPVPVANLTLEHGRALSGLRATQCPCMESLGIRHGDLIHADTSLEIRSGDLVFVENDGPHICRLECVALQDPNRPTWLISNLVAQKRPGDDHTAFRHASDRAPCPCAAPISKRANY
jgi:hypothetical protein